MLLTKSGFLLLLSIQTLSNTKKHFWMIIVKVYGKFYFSFNSKCEINSIVMELADNGDVF